VSAVRGPGTTGADLGHLRGRLAVLELRVRTAVAARRQADPAADDLFRGLYVTDEQVDQLLAAGPASPGDDPAAALAAEVEAATTTSPLRELAASFELESIDLDLLLAALAPDLDARFERLYGYLNDDVSRRRASIGLALELAGADGADPAARDRLHPSAPLVRAGLLLVEDAERPFLTRSLRVPDRVAGHLLGDERPDPELLEALAGPPAEHADHELVGALANALAGRPGREATGARLAYLREQPGGDARALAAAALAAAGAEPVMLDLARLGPATDPARLASLAGCEARLRGGALVAGPADPQRESNPRVLVLLAALAGQGVTVVLHGREAWDPAWSERVALLADAPAPGRAARLAFWRSGLNGDGPWDGNAAGLSEAQLDELAGQLVLAPTEVGRAITAARLAATLDGGSLTLAHLRAGARSRNSAGLERLARRFEPGVGWVDLVLPPGTMGELRELAARARHRDRVLREWGMRPGGGRGRGITALFAGDSGTGKTMSAEVVAGDLGLDLYVVDLAMVVDKYVGETEKNLERIFREAAEVNGVLLFDEADALFGKRSEVRDAHDRYANVEIAYLLQRMEAFDGLAVLSTNLRANLDEAFTRRLDAIVDFPTPEEPYRLRLWRRCLAPLGPDGSDVDLGFLAKSFELSGGSIRAAAVTTAYLVAEAGRAVTMADVIRAVGREYRKLGRLCLPTEFGRYHALLDIEGGSDADP
jgi:hypothetical protein